MTTKTTPPLDVEAIRARADAATPGPWFVEEVEDGESCPDGSGSVNGYVESGAICSPPESDEDPPIIADDVYHAGNRVFISRARADVPLLCDALEAALAEVALLRAVVDALPRCACGQPATRALRYDIGQRECDKCGPTGIFADLPHADALRALFAGGAR